MVFISFHYMTKPKCGAAGKNAASFTLSVKSILFIMKVLQLTLNKS